MTFEHMLDVFTTRCGEIRLKRLREQNKADKRILDNLDYLIELNERLSKIMQEKILKMKTHRKW